MEYNFPYLCPMLNRNINMNTCFDIHMLIDDGAPDWTVPQEVFSVGNYKEICRACPYHRDD
ncbi:MAG: hypothetical protein ACI4WX_12335 [Aristaeellaceae bacterium]